MEGYLATAGLSTTSIVLLGVLYKIGKGAIGRRLVSDCCGKKFEVGLDIRDMPHSPTQSEKIHPRSVEEELSVESLSLSLPKDLSHLGGLRISQSVRTHLPQQVEEEETAHESSAEASSESKV